MTGEPHLSKLSVVVPARNEAHCIASMVEHLYLELKLNHVPHEIVVVNDGSTDLTKKVLSGIREDVPTLRVLDNHGSNGFAYAVIYGLDRIQGDAAVIMMADESDDCRDVVQYWYELSKGADCVFGSRFIKGAGVIDYPWFKYFLNRLGNKFIQLMFGIKYNDVTNAFKAYRKSVLDGCRPFISRHFNFTVELPLKAIVRGYRWTAIPITWRNRRSGLAKFRIQEIGGRYLFVILYVWLERFLCKSDYRMGKNESREEET